MKRQPVTSVTNPMNDKKNNNEKKSLASRLHITFKDEENCKDVWSISMNNTHIIAAIAAIVLIIGSGMFALFVWTPLHNILPGYMKSDTRTQLIDDALRIDSLSYQMSLRDKYMENIARILNDEITIDSISRSEGMAGAACLSAQAALRAGSGLVTAACCAPVRLPMQNLVPCAMAKVVSTGTALDAGAALELYNLAQGKRALAICSISDSLVTGEELDAEARQNTFTTMMEIALKTAVAMDKK